MDNINVVKQKRQHSLLETRHSNVADALDSLGSGIIAKRTKSAPPGSLMPKGWKPRYDADGLNSGSCKKGKETVEKVKTGSTVERVGYFDDIAIYISFHRIDYDRLQQMGWKATLRIGPEWTHEMAKAPRRENVFAGLGFNEHLPETHLVMLDSEEVLSNERCQTLHRATDKVHMTGPDTRRRTDVLSSIALLAISVWCENMSWENMRRSFHSLGYIWGQEEREIVALHGFLNWIVAIRHLLGIENVCFKRDVVSYSTSVFSNSVRPVFPGSPPLSCYPHIIRKFKTGERSGNGSYAAKVKNTDHLWLKAEAEKAIEWCSLCKTEQQMLKMWELTKK
ncbi:hypothetical protein IV203_007598 [Nitzschia inconspicua]|uniref:Uncharacterized protein n=1 Tax=Nitzschia inconspicua TaxID=303405 RepID=A0A9K3PD39_9STRA|nr:hypothetical protein IV203_007598 [Nitzschia inconspicua]